MVGVGKTSKGEIMKHDSDLIALLVGRMKSDVEDYAGEVVTQDTTADYIEGAQDGVVAVGRILYDLGIISGNQLGEIVYVCS
jgi:hypothetical protein